jgi:hypothetical protein
MRSASSGGGTGNRGELVGSGIPRVAREPVAADDEPDPVSLRSGGRPGISGSKRYYDIVLGFLDGIS